MGIISDQHASYKLLAKELSARGYRTSEEYEDGHLYAVYASPQGKIWRTRAALLDYPFTSSTVKALSKNKAEATRFVIDHGINAPATLEIDPGYVNESLIKDFIARYGRVVVKPLNRSLSIGLTTDVTTFIKAQKAIAKAGRYSNTVLMQEQVFGEEVRFAVINGTVESALQRQTPRVVGDGFSTIAELVKRENKRRENIDFTTVPYPKLTSDLIHPSVDTSVVPLEGVVVELSRATMISKGCSVYDVLGDMDPSYIELVESLVEDMDAGFIVVDIFLKDFREPLSPDNHWFIEFNTSPVLKLFYSCRDGNMHDILPPLADAIETVMHTPQRSVVGSFEAVSLPSIGIKHTIAKIDTGAFSGAISCSYAKVVKEEGKKVLRFSPGKRSKKIYETDTFSEKFVRSSNGHREKRYVIDTEIIIRDKPYPITITLSDRSEMKHEILIGRRFLREQNLLVDVSVNQEYDTDSEAN